MIFIILPNDLNGTQFRWNTSLRWAHVAVKKADGDKDGIQESAHKSGIDTMNVEQDDVIDFESRSEDPDDEDIDEGKDDSPDEGKRESQDCGDEAIQPESNAREDQERQAPDEFESLWRIRLRQDVIKVEIDVSIDPLVVAIHDIESDGEVLSGNEGRCSLLLLFRFLHLLFLLSLLAAVVFRILSFGLQFDGVLVVCAALSVVRLFQ